MQLTIFYLTLQTLPVSPQRARAFPEERDGLQCPGGLNDISSGTFL